MPPQSCQEIEEGAAGHERCDTPKKEAASSSCQALVKAEPESSSCRALVKAEPEQPEEAGLEKPFVSVARARRPAFDGDDGA